MTKVKEIDNTPLGIIRQRRIRLRNIGDIKSFLIKLILLIIILSTLFGYIFGIETMKNNDMFPKIGVGDLLFYYRLDKKYSSSNIVVFTKNNTQYVGRIVAKSGDKLSFSKDQRLIVNDSIVTENNIFYKTGIYKSDVRYPLTLKKDQYFILCDYREGSRDSRYFGPVNKAEIKGKVITVVRRTNI